MALPVNFTLGLRDLHMDKRFSLWFGMSMAKEQKVLKLTPEAIFYVLCDPSVNEL
jgi:hypothetical protein